MRSTSTETTIVRLVGICVLNCSDDAEPKLPHWRNVTYVCVSLYPLNVDKLSNLDCDNDKHVYIEVTQSRVLLWHHKIFDK